MSEALVFERATPAHHASLGRLFRRADCPCFCAYYGFSGDHRAWQDRQANEAERSELELEGQLEAGEALLLVARRGAEVVGWLRIDEPPRLRKIYEGRLYRGLPCFGGERDGVWAVGCFLVDPSERRRGVARGLLLRALELLEATGARAVEAFPRGAEDVSDGEQFTGPLRLYESLGFQRVTDFAPYPVLRRVLSR